MTAKKNNNKSKKSSSKNSCNKKTSCSAKSKCAKSCVKKALTKETNIPVVESVEPKKQGVFATLLSLFRKS